MGISPRNGRPGIGVGRNLALDWYSTWCSDIPRRASTPRNCATRVITPRSAAFLASAAESARHILCPSDRAVRFLVSFCGDSSCLGPASSEIGSWPPATPSFDGVNQVAGKSNTAQWALCCASARHSCRQLSWPTYPMLLNDHRAPLWPGVKSRGRAPKHDWGCGQRAGFSKQSGFFLTPLLSTPSLALNIGYRSDPQRSVRLGACTISSVAPRQKAPSTYVPRMALSLRKDEN